MAHTEIRVVCTNHGRHRRRLLAYFSYTAPLTEGERAAWERDNLGLPDGQRLSPDEAVSGWLAVDQSRRGGHRVRDYAVPLVRQRADGGRTFELRPCPTCGRQAERPLRDTALTVAAASGESVIDMRPRRR